MMYFQDIQDVRKCYIQFLMSFFIIGDNDLIKHLLDMKGVLSFSNISNN